MDRKITRSQAEEALGRARRPHETPMSLIDVERDATRKKTAKLRELRLAKEGSGVTPIDKASKTQNPKD